MCSNHQNYTISKRGKKMRKYEATIVVGLDTHKEVIEAKNYSEAKDKALSTAHGLSEYGNGKFLQSVTVKCLKNPKKEEV